MLDYWAPFGTYIQRSASAADKVFDEDKASNALEGGLIAAVSLALWNGAVRAMGGTELKRDRIVNTQAKTVDSPAPPSVAHGRLHARIESTVGGLDHRINRFVFTGFGLHHRSYAAPVRDGLKPAMDLSIIRLGYCS